MAALKKIGYRFLIPIRAPFDFRSQFSSMGRSTFGSGIPLLACFVIAPTVYIFFRSLQFFETRVITNFHNLLQLINAANGAVGVKRNAETNSQDEVSVKNDPLPLPDTKVPCDRKESRAFEFYNNYSDLDINYC